MEKVDKRWSRFDDRPKCQKFVCPHCGQMCYCKPKGAVGITFCDYSYCPHCGKPVIPDKPSEE